MDLVRARKKAKEKTRRKKERKPTEGEGIVEPRPEDAGTSAPSPVATSGDEQRALEKRPSEPDAQLAPAEADEEFLALAEEELYQQQMEEEALAEEGEHYELLGLTLGQEEYGIEIHWVEEIIRPRPLTEVPRAPEYIAGVISLRGNIIPVIDLRKRLGISREHAGGNDQAPGSDYQKIIVVSDPETRQPFGLFVGEVTEVVRLPVRELEPAPPTLGGESAFILGIGWVEKKMIIMLMIEELLRLGVVGGRSE